MKTHCRYMHLFGLLYIGTLFATKNYVQTLVFGKDMEDGVENYFCDYNLNPNDHVLDVTIFKIVDGDMDKAVAYRIITPSKLSNNARFYRIEIPSELASTECGYSFFFNIIGGEGSYSESWRFDNRKNKFALSSSIEKRYLEDPRVLWFIGTISVVCFFFGVRHIYKRYSRRDKSMI